TQISSSKKIINAIYDAQAKVSSNRLLAMKTEIALNLGLLREVTAPSQRKHFEQGMKICETPLATAVYFSSPTVFQFRKDPTDQKGINEKIALLYAKWEYANNLIKATNDLLLLYKADLKVKQQVLRVKNGKILQIFDETGPIALQILQALDEELGAG